jgi:hypothetical protein
MSQPLLKLSADRIRMELRRVKQATEAEAIHNRRRNIYAAVAIAIWFAGVVILGGAFHTTSMELGSVLLLLGPMVATFGPIAVAYSYWVTSGEL